MTKMTIEVTPLQAAVVEAISAGADMNLCKYVNTNQEAREFLAPFIGTYGRVKHRKHLAFTVWSVGNGMNGASAFIKQRRPDHG